MLCGEGHKAGFSYLDGEGGKMLGMMPNERLSIRVRRPTLSGANSVQNMFFCKSQFKKINKNI